jgi:predicted phage baseplate assembly protein
VATTEADGEYEWTEVPDFANSAHDDRHFMWEGATGEIQFGPAVRDADGATNQYGMVPPLDAQVHVTGYRHGGGAAGNVGARTLTVPKTTIPFVGRVENLRQATGGVDAETVEAAKARGPMWLRSGQRAVTKGDFERIALESSPNVARARCIEPAGPGEPIDVLIVPQLDIAPADLQLNDLAIPAHLRQVVAGYIDDRRTLSSTVRLRTPSYQGVTVIARLVAADGASVDQIKDRALGQLNRYINPLVGGPDGTGWPFGRDLNMGEIFALLANLDGVVGVEEVRLFVADLARDQGGDRKDGGQSIRLRPDALFASFQHQVMVRENR